MKDRYTMTVHLRNGSTVTQDVNQIHCTQTDGIDTWVNPSKRTPDVPLFHERDIEKIEIVVNR